MRNAGHSVVVGLSGGLGNQLFQYAAGRALALKLGTSVRLDLSWFIGRSERSFALADFAIVAKIVPPLPLPDSLVQLESRASRRWAARRNGVPIFREKHFQFDPAFDALTRPVFLEGFWQSERYFAAHRLEIHKDLSLIRPLPSTGRTYLSQIAQADAICVHVRRGDYVSNPVAALTHGSCSPQYYRTAVSEVARSLRHPHCFVFSDEPDWAKQNLRLDAPATFVEAHSTNEPHWDLALMSACKHFVIANSSLSWWAAWLGGDAEKRVVAPSPWFRDPARDTRDLLPPSWRVLGASQ